MKSEKKGSQAGQVFGKFSLVEKDLLGWDFVCRVFELPSSRERRALVQKRLNLSTQAGCSVLPGILKRLLEEV